MIAVIPMVNAIAPPAGTRWVVSQVSPPGLVAATWQTGTASVDGRHTTFSYRTYVGSTSFLQIYANGRYNNFAAQKQGAGMAGHQNGLGALTDDAVQSAAGALISELKSEGCTDGYSQTVQTFQSAYVAAGGSLPNDSNGSSGVDGYYGANTQSALQAVLDAGPNQPPESAPAGCVGSGGGGGGGGGGSTSPTTTTSGTDLTVPLLIGGGLVVAGVLGVMLYKKKHRRR